MKLKVGLKFRIFYGQGNPNNIPYMEVRGIVDDQIVLLCCTKGGRIYYKMISDFTFNFNIENDCYVDFNYTLEYSEDYIIDQIDEDDIPHPDDADYDFEISFVKNIKQGNNLLNLEEGNCWLIKK